MLCCALHATVDGRQRLICSPAIVPAAAPETTACSTACVTQAVAAACAKWDHHTLRGARCGLVRTSVGGKIEPFNHRTQSNAFRHAGDASQQVRSPDGSGGALTAKLVATCPPHNRTATTTHSLCLCSLHSLPTSCPVHGCIYTRPHSRLLLQGLHPPTDLQRAPLRPAPTVRSPTLPPLNLHAHLTCILYVTLYAAGMPAACAATCSWCSEAAIRGQTLPTVLPAQAAQAQPQPQP